MRKWILLSLTLVILAGCGQVTAGARRSSNGSLSARSNRAAETAAYRSSSTTAERAEKLERHVTGIEGVDRASVVITGNTAIVGISLAGELEDFSDRRLMRLKARIESEIRQLEPSLAYVAVTASNEFVERINDIADPLGVDDTPPRINPDIDRIIDELTPPV